MTLIFEKDTSLSKGNCLANFDFINISDSVILHFHEVVDNRS